MHPSVRTWAAAAATGFALLFLTPSDAVSQDGDRPRARDIGLRVGVFEPGPYNAITDVAGVRVGHATVVREPNVRTGVTAILPHGKNPYLSRVPAAIHVGNGFGKLLGVTQVRELGELETPILLTCTLCVWKAADALVGWMLERPGMEEVRSLNAVVGETNDGRLNDIRSRPITPEDVRRALETATDGPVAEGAVGAGAGTVAFGWKGGIGTSSRVLPRSLGGYTVGVLVQTNFGGILRMGGAPVGRELGQYAFMRETRSPDEAGDRLRSSRSDEGRGGAAKPGPGAGAHTWKPQDDGQEWGSIMMVVATDAPLSDRNLERVARRAVMGLARTGSYASNGSGDYVIAFSTAREVRRDPRRPLLQLKEVANDRMSGIFEATVEATEEAIYNSLLKAETVTSNGRTVEALPLKETLEVLRAHRVIPSPEEGRHGAAEGRPGTAVSSQGRWDGR
ncbi:MAG: P1 family peptidase [Gemmatimonadota bacterium]